MNTRSTFLASLLVVSMLLPFGASAATYSDVPADSALRPAVDYLREKGIIQDAEKFNPNEKLNRAQAAKIIVAPLVPAEELAKVTSTSFTDVPTGSWFLSFVEAARIMNVVQTVEKFNPERPVTKAEFIKMTLAARGIDYQGAFADITTPLSSDVSSNTDWYYPVMRYALASTMTAISEDGKLNPAQEITRGQMALLTYRLDMYAAGQRTQAGLAQGETEIANVLQQLEKQQPVEAEYASNRSVLSTRGALAAKPDEAIVKAAVKVSEAFSHLVQGYKAGAAGQLDVTIAQAKAAYASADAAQGFSATLAPLADQIRQIAKQMAEEARAMQAKVGTPQ